MKIFITGGTGFIGTPIVKKLAERDHDVYVLCIDIDSEKSLFAKYPNVKLISGRLPKISEWIDEVRNINPDATIHIAWEGIPDYSYEMCRKNLEYTLALYSALADIGCKKIITTGSCWEYGQIRGILKEDSKLTPEKGNAVSGTKIAMQSMGRALANEKKFAFIWGRIFYAYGPKQKAVSLIPTIIKSINEGQVPKIQTPDSKNDFIFVEDIADAFVALVEKVDKSGTYNVGTGQSTSVKEIIKNVYLTLGKHSEWENIKHTFDRNPNQSSEVDFYADMDRITTDTGWRPKYDIAEGLKKTVKYFVEK